MDGRGGGIYFNTWYLVCESFNEWVFSYLDIFPYFTEFKICIKHSCIWCCDKSSFSIGELQRTLCSERKKLQLLANNDNFWGCFYSLNSVDSLKDPNRKNSNELICRRCRFLSYLLLPCLTTTSWSCNRFNLQIRKIFHSLHYSQAWSTEMVRTYICCTLWHKLIQLVHQCLETASGSQWNQLPWFDHQLVSKMSHKRWICRGTLHAGPT